MCGHQDHDQPEHHQEHNAPAGDTGIRLLPVAAVGVFAIAYGRDHARDQDQKQDRDGQDDSDERNHKQVPGSVIEKGITAEEQERQGADDRAISGPQVFRNEYARKLTLTVEIMTEPAGEDQKPKNDHDRKNTEKQEAGKVDGGHLRTDSRGRI